MDASRLAREIAGFDSTAPIAHAWTPPSSWYVEEAFHQLERGCVFGTSWQPVCRVSEVEAPGSYVSGCLVGEPWLVVRDEQRALRGFANTCRHKGREVVVGAGAAGELVCGYHGWSYGLDGRLQKAPRVAGIEDFDRATLSLPPLAVQVWGPWVFVNRDVSARPLQSQFPELCALLDASGWEQLRFVERRSWELACNWKVFVDNYLDGGYHIPYMHPSLEAQLDMAGYRTELFERSSLQTAPPSGVPDDRIAYAAEQRIGAGAIYGWLFPNFMVNRYGRCLDSNHVVPLASDRCRVDYEFYFASGADGGVGRHSFVEDSVAQSEVTQLEDIAICESVQRGLASSSYDRGRYAPRVEIGEHHFHRLLAEAFAGSLARGPGPDS